MLIRLTLCLFLAASACAWAQPKLEIQTGDKYNWGDVHKSDDPLEARIPLKNVGDETLIVRNVRTSCSCTVAPLDKDTLAPNETTYMTVKLDIRGKMGKIEKSISISTNNPVLPVSYLTVGANIIVPIAVTPAYFRFPELAVGQKSTSTVELTNTTDEAIIIVDAIPNSPVELDLKTPLVLGPGERVLVNATILPEKEGPLRLNLSVKTSNPEQPFVEIRGFGHAL